MVMSESVPTHDLQNGRNGRVVPNTIHDTAEILEAPNEGPSTDRPRTPPETASESLAGEGGVRLDDAAGRDDTAPRFAGQREIDTARLRAETLSGRAHADAEELLSRARVHAELLRTHAEAARAEAQALRAEAAALRRAAGDEAATANSRAEALRAHAQAVAEEFRLAMEDQAGAARTEVERLRTEAMSLRRLLKAEIDAGLADRERLRAEVQGLWAEAERVAAELRLLSRSDEAAAPLRVEVTGQGGGRPSDGRLPAPPAPVTPSAGGNFGDVPAPVEAGRAPSPIAAPRTASGRLEDLRRAIAVEVEQRLAEVYAEPEDGLATAAAGPGYHDANPVAPRLDVGKLLKDIWEAAYTELTQTPGGAGMPDNGHRSGHGTVQAPPSEHLVHRHLEEERPPEPLIGSGGWRARPTPTSATPPSDDPGGGEAAFPPPAPERHRRFRHPG